MVFDQFEVFPRIPGIPGIKLQDMETMDTPDYLGRVVAPEGPPGSWARVPPAPVQGSPS